MDSQQALAKKTILDVLEQTQGTLSVKEIRTAVWTILQTKIPDYYLSRLLRALSAEGYVNFKHGRWAIGVSDKAQNILSRSSVGKVNYPDLSSLGIDALSGDSHQFDPVNSASDPGHYSANDSAQKIFEESGPWGKFRKLITYYK